MNDQQTSKEVSIYDIDAPLELSQVKRRDERDFPDTLMRYTNPWAICAMQDRRWLIERVEHLEQETVKASLFVRACLAAVGRPHDHADVPIGSDVDLEELGLQIIGLIEEGKTTLEPAHDPAVCDANERLATIMVGAAGKHAERVVELEAEVSTLRESLTEVNRLLSLNVSEVERLRSTPPPGASWVSVGERLPELEAKVLYAFNGYTWLGRYKGLNDGLPCFAGPAGFISGDATHWMLCPEPPASPSTKGSEQALSCAFCGAELRKLPGRPRECCEEGKRRDASALGEGE